MWQCFMGSISEPYLKNWEPQTVRPNQDEPSIYDVLHGCEYICSRLNFASADKNLSDCIQVDWGGWAYKATKEQVKAYNTECGQFAIPESVIEKMEDGVTYGIICVEML